MCSRDPQCCSADIAAVQNTRMGDGVLLHCRYCCTALWMCAVCSVHCCSANIAAVQILLQCYRTLHVCCCTADKLFSCWQRCAMCMSHATFASSTATCSKAEMRTASLRTLMVQTALHQLCTAALPLPLHCTATFATAEISFPRSFPPGPDSGVRRHVDERLI